MKKFFQCTAALLCCALIAGILPARATEGGAFLSVTVETIDSDGNVQTAGDVCYTDGQDLYVTPDFLCRYTLYYYDDASAAFVRAGQEPGSKYGCVVLNAAEKSVLMYPNPECPFSYTLRDVFEFGGEYFLPLDQMAGYLKARVLVEGTTVTIANSGYSMADAEYAFSKIETDKAYTGYDYTSIVDDLYGGSEAAFRFSTLKNYFSSCVFLQLSNIDFIFQSGNQEEYESFLERCVTDNSTYLEAAGADNLQQRFADAQDLNREINTYANKFNEITTLVNKAAEPAKDSGLDTALLYLDTRDWGAVLSTVADCTGYLDYLLALGAMSEDHRNMLRAFDPAGTGEKNAPLERAVRNLKGRYTNDVTLNLVNTAGQILVDQLKQQAGDAILEAVIPSTAVISGVATAFKLLGYDLTGNQEYSILIDFSAKYALRRAYWALPHNYDSSEQTEAYRLGVIFFLLACRETFRAANQIAVTTDVPGDYYDPQIETIESVLNLFYAAARSREFDSRTGWQEIIRQNESAIAESGIASAAPTLTEEEALALSNLNNTDLIIQQNNINNGANFAYNENVFIYANSYFDQNTKQWKDDLISKPSYDSKKETVLVQDTMIGSFGIYANQLFYINRESNQLIRCNLDGSDPVSLFSASEFDDQTDAQPVNFAFSGSNIILVLANQQLWRIHFSDGEKAKIDCPPSEYGALYAFNNKIFYLSEGRLICIDLNNSQYQVISEQYENRKLAGLSENTLYSWTYTDGTTTLYGMNLNTNEEKIAQTYTFTFEYYGPPFQLCQGHIFAQGGTGAGNMLALIENGTLNFDPPSLDRFSFGTNIGIYKDTIIAREWSALTGEESTYTLMYPIA